MAKKNTFWNTPVTGGNSSQNDRRNGNHNPKPGPAGNRGGGMESSALRSSGQIGHGPESPYAFVPFPAQEPFRGDIAEIYAQGGLLTGWFDVRLLTKTGLIMPDGMKIQVDANKHKTMPFYTLPDGTPAIPGSELRGLIRSTYETASNSCVPFLLNDKPTSMRLPTGAALKSRGLLELREGKWLLWEAEDHSMRAARFPDQRDLQSGTFQGKRPGDLVRFAGGQWNIRLTNNSSDSQGWIQFSSPVVWPREDKGDHYHIHVLQKQGARPIYQWSDDEPYQAIREELTREGTRETMRDGAEKIHKELLRKLEAIRKQGNGILPIFYLKTESRFSTHYHVAVSAIGRINQLRKWKDIMGKYGPCESAERSCPACQLFGNINQEMMIRGRVRVTDGLPVGQVSVSNYVTLPILGGPKPTAYEYYIKKPDQVAKFWNYDFYSVIVKKGGRQEPEFRQREDFSPLGRKYYWHHKPVASEQEKGDLNVTTQVAPEGQTFSFRVYFDRITEKQYRQLIWVMTLGENREDSALQLKLGHGRPLGYGSVKLVIDRATVRTFSMEEGHISWRTEERKVSAEPGCPFEAVYKKTLDSLLTVSDAKAELKYAPVYPTAANNKGEVAIFNWYAKNRTLNSGHPYPDVLKPITENAKKPRETKFET